ncbi:MAG TPA: 50S ribosomal protein L25 [Myxococcales bacterium]|nr:50S ribosomal protein L25 [Myxococcales bacterium]HIN86746.1 50S ribosomal protein L25 [Myxococcales bacterium]
MTTLKARRRVGTGKGAGRRIRDRGMVPAVLYGNGGEAVNLALEPKAAKAILTSGRGINSVFTLEVDGGETVPMARIINFQKHPVRRTLVHCDIQRLDPTKIRLFKVPVQLTGESPAVKIGCKLTFSTRIVRVNCLPSDCPETFEVNIDGLDPGDIIRIEELEVPETLELLYRDNAPIVSVTATAIVYEEDIEDEAEGEEGAEGEGAEGEGAEGEGASDGSGK